MNGAALRVLMTTDTVGGVWTFTASLARGLGVSGCDVTVVTLGPRPSEAQRRDLVDIKLVETDLALEWQDPSGTDIARARRELGQLAARCRPDIVHLNSFREAGYGWPAPVLVVAHSCVKSWAAACGAADMIAAPPWQNYIAAVTEGLQAASAWVAPTAFFRDQIAAHYGVAAGHVIWNGCADIPAAAKRPFILSAGRVWDQAKNFQALIAASGQLDWPVVIAGASGTSDDIGMFDHARNVEMRGELSHRDTLALMQEAGIFVSTALYEPFGLGALEAARAGCALVLADIGSFRELWGGAALLLADEPDALAKAINHVCRDDDLRHRLQASARRRARRYSAVRMTSRYLSLYQDIVRWSHESIARPAASATYAEMPA